MAGGMGGTGGGSDIPLRDRVRLGHSAPPTGTTPTPPAPATTPTASIAPATAARHCWVASLDDPAAVTAGLLLRWEQRRDGWYGEVVHLSTATGRPATVIEWLPATRLVHARA